MRAKYDPTDWYWKVGTDESSVWASGRLAFVPVSDADYQAWVARSDTITSTIRDAADLLGVMLAQWMPRVLAAGVAVHSTATPALNAVYSFDPNGSAARPGLTAITGISTGIASGKPLPSGGATFLYSDITGASHAFTAADFLNFAAAAEGYVYSLTQAVAARIAGGTDELPTVPLVIA